MSITICPYGRMDGTSVIDDERHTWHGLFSLKTSRQCQGYSRGWCILDLHSVDGRLRLRLIQCLSSHRNSLLQLNK